MSLKNEIITLPFREFLSLCLPDYKDKPIAISPQLGKLIREEIDPEEQLVHVHEPWAERGYDSWTLWNVRFWRMDIRRYEMQKEEARKRQEEHTRNNLLKHILRRNMAKKLGGREDESSVIDLVNTIVHTQDALKAEFFGVDINASLEELESLV